MGAMEKELTIHQRVVQMIIRDIRTFIRPRLGLMFVFSADDLRESQNKTL